MSRGFNTAPRPPARRCEQGDRCAAWALPWITERAVCHTHATDAEREVNKTARDAWVLENERMENTDLPDDVILHTDPKFCWVQFGYRPDAIAAFKKVAGATFNQEMKVWLFPLHRLEKVRAICGRYFQEVIDEPHTDEQWEHAS